MPSYRLLEQVGCTQQPIGTDEFNGTILSVMELISMQLHFYRMQKQTQGEVVY
jgi:hypothetical protein